MKLLAFADTQIGVTTVALDDQRDVLDRIVQVALDEQVDLVVHGGDVFEGAVITPEHLRTLVDATAPLRNASIPIVILRGNGRHDLATRSVHGLDILREIEGFRVSDRPEVIRFPGVNVCTLPWVHPGRLIAQYGMALGHEGVNALAARLLLDTAGSIAAEAGPFSPAVLVAHWAISGATLPTGLPTDMMGEPVLSWPDLTELGYDAIIGAHIHQPCTLSSGFDKTVGVVVGSPQQLNFGEHGEHGVGIVTVGEQVGTTTARMVPIESRRFVTLDLDAADLAGDHVKVHGEDGLPIVGDGDIVRVRYQADEQQARMIDHTHIRRVLEEAGAQRVQIEPTIVRSERVRVDALSEQLSPAQALALWCDADGVDGPLRERMLATLGEWST